MHGTDPGAAADIDARKPIVIPSYSELAGLIEPELGVIPAMMQRTVRLITGAAGLKGLYIDFSVIAR